MSERDPIDFSDNDIAIVGMAGQFPGARSIDGFWHNLSQGIESIARFTPDELELPPGLAPATAAALRNHPNFVPAGAALEVIDRFDHAFFDVSRREAEWMDPQQRLFLQCVWAALEDAAIDPERFPGRIALYAGATDSGYSHLVQQQLPQDPAAHFEVGATATHESLATKVSYKLGLTGESLLLYTACSTGLVCVHMACQSLLLQQCDAALAGAVRIVVPQRTGYLYQDGLIFSPDGHCRAFDARARGTVGGNGVAAIVLKRLGDALASGDPIRALIKGSAINNDGRHKSGFTAPSVEGQAAVIRQAIEYAGLDPSDIGYVETHGTATPLGDPIEIAALQRAYTLDATRRRTIPIGSVKTNIGHLDTVAGLAGLIKAVKSLEQQAIPPSLHFERPNPEIDFDAGPFFVNTRLRPWPSASAPRRAAVSAFGVGGTNAHAVLEEAPPQDPSGPSTRPEQLIVLSARSEPALDRLTHQLAAHVTAEPPAQLADLAYTLALGRRAFEHRRTIVARDAADLAAKLARPPAAVRTSDGATARRQRIALIFPGQGSQQIGMARALYQATPVFAQHVDQGLAALPDPLGRDVRQLLFAAPDDTGAARLRDDTGTALPALFITEYALAQTWIALGVRPHALLGHSFGEYVAACLAGVFTVGDALALAAARGRLMRRLPPGAMLAVGLAENEVRPLLSGRLALAALNAPARAVVSGPVAEITQLEETLRRRDVGVLRLPAPHAFHSADVEPLGPELVQVAAALTRSAPTLRYVSTLTGTWAQAADTDDPRFFADQMRQPVRFAAGIQTLLADGCTVFIEAGPGHDLGGLVRACLSPEDKARIHIVPSLRRAGSSTSDHAVFLASLGALWSIGLEIDWPAFYQHEPRRRLALPTYSFEEKRCWVDAVAAPAPLALPATAPSSEPGAGAGAGAGAGGWSAAPPPVAQAAALPAAAAASSATAPRGPIETQIAAMWRERLGLDQLNRDDNFLELGGNSLIAAQLLTQLRDTFGVDVPLADLFEAPTVAGIAARIEALQAARSGPAPLARALPLTALPRTRDLPLSYVQERVWRLEQYRPGLSAYIIPFVLRLEGPLDRAVLARAIAEIVARHEALRTTYPIVDGQVVQRHHAAVDVPLDFITLAGSAAEREAEMLRLAREDAARPYDLVNGPVLRTTLVALDTALHVLIGSIHHIVCDTVSVLVFVSELGQLYDAYRQGRPSPLPPLVLQYADFGAWQRRSMAEGMLAEQVAWWRQRLAGMPPRIELPTDRPAPAECPLTSRRIPITLSPALADRIAAFCVRESVTTYTTLLAAWQALLSRYSGQSDIAVGTPIGNRTRPELIPLIGYVAHSVVLRTDLGDDPSFRTLLDRVHQVVLDAQAHPDVPYEALAAELHPERDLGKGRVTDSVFVLHSGLNHSAGLPLPGVAARIIEVPDTPVQWGTTLANLSLILFEEPGQIHGAIEFATELFDEPRVRAMMAHLEALLESALAAPDQPISQLALTTAQERAAWPQPLPRPAGPRLLERLQHHAATQPDALAATQGECQLTWSALAALAHQITAALAAPEPRLTPGTPVVVCLGASPEKLAATWAVLAAGGAVVALGPTDLGRLADYAPARSSDALPWCVTTRDLLSVGSPVPARVLYVEDLAARAPAAPPAALPAADQPAWLFPAGAAEPAWVLTHRGLDDLFAAFAERLGPALTGPWLAAAEPGSERAELELLFALSRGLPLVFAPPAAARLLPLAGLAQPQRPLELSLSYFANDEDAMRGPKYELFLEGARFADTHGFAAVWTPERHFHSFGGLYPQPAVTAAALATITRNVRLRSGSVVLPLHDPLLIAEQWSVVDNLSGGRVDLSVATGWHVHDFVFAPERYRERHAVLARHLEILRALWRGERFTRPGGNNIPVEVALRPRPVQAELPIWLTATANPEVFRLAGEIGAGVLTGLFAHSLAELQPKIALYRESWRRSGHPGRGHITLMLHTFIGSDEATVLDEVREPLRRYFRGSVEITASLLANQGHQRTIEQMSAADIDAILDHGFAHYARASGLIGTAESALDRLRAVRQHDVDEVACLIDFGLDTPEVLASLERLSALLPALAAEETRRATIQSTAAEHTLAETLALAARRGASVWQLSAALARRLSQLHPLPAALTAAHALLVDSSATLAQTLAQAAGVPAWLPGSADTQTLLLRRAGEPLPQGITAWVLDPIGQPVPPGVVGELALSGVGLPERLWNADANPRRFAAYPVAVAADASPAPLWRTGRRVRMNADGQLQSVAGALAPVRAATPPSPARKRAASSAPPPITPVPRDRPLSLSFIQERLWYLHQFDPAGAAYNNPAMFRLTGVLDVAALQAALTALVARHEALRTTYTLTDQGTVQVVHPQGDLPLIVDDLSDRDAATREAEVLERCRTHALAPFDLERGPVVRAQLYRLQDEEHVLSLVLHHIVSDAYCVPVLARELGALYLASAAGLPVPLAPLPIQVADYAVWQRRWLEGAALEAQLDWWKRELSGVAPLELALDQARPPVQDYAGAAHHFLLERELAEPLLALGRREGATPFMALLALWQTLLHRYSGQDDFAIGTPIAGRNRPEIEGLIGCFVNTLPMRAQLSGRPTFRELLRRVRQHALGAYANQDAPFERIVDLLELPRDLSRSPVFQVMLNLINVPQQSAALPGLQLAPVTLPASTAKFDLNLEAIERPDGLDCRLEYATALFEPATLVRMSQHLAALARAAVAHPDRPLAELSLLDPAEEHLLRVAWNPPAPPVAPAALPERFAAQVARTPHAIAIIDGAQRLDYTQLDQRATQLARALRARGVGTETPVGVYLGRSADLIVAVLGILKAGAAYVPLDPSYPKERLAFIVRDARLRILVTRACDPFDRTLGDQPLDWLELDDATSLAAASPAPLDSATPAPAQLAYLVYTSGSTGVPKAVAVEHRQLVAFVDWAGTLYTPAELAGTLAATSIAFDMSVLEVFVPLCCGGTLILARDILGLPELAARDRITLVNAVPSALRELITAYPLPEGVRTVNCGGEALPRELADQLYRIPHIERVYDLYGPSETTVFSTFVLRRPDHRATIGRPITGTRVYVLSPTLELNPIGVPGELYIGGRGVARGYFQRPALTADRFIPDPFTSEPGQRLYRTGDRARWLADGTLEFLGRNDFQVKLRGFRIELGEIESALRAHPAIEDAVVIAREDIPTDKRLVAYLVPRQTPLPATSELKQHLQHALPEYMVPSAFVELTALPLSANGKLDRRALPPPPARFDHEQPLDRPARLPQTPTETALCEIYSAVLHLPSGLRDTEQSFFALGGHSLLATQVISRVRNTFHVDLPLRTVFEAPTPSALARRIEHAQQHGDAALSTLAAISRQGPLPLSFAQQRLWFIDRLEPDSAAYNMPLALQLQGQLSLPALRAAFATVIARHETLRTTFGEHDGAPVQHIHPPGPFTLPLDDLSDLPPPAQHAEVARRATEDAERPFDLAAGPLLRATLLRLDAAQHVLLLCMHHITSDGWSMDILARELAQSYAAHAAGRAPDLPPLPIQYVDYAAWQRTWLQGPALAQQLAYWKQQLHGLTPLELPTDHARPAVASQRGAAVAIQLSAALSQSLRTLAEQRGATLFMVLLAAFQSLLGRLAGTHDVAVGSPIAGRTRSEVEGLIGFFVNTLVLRADLAGDPTFIALLDQVKATALGAYAHQDIPFEKLVEELAPPRDLSRAPLFQVMFVLQNNPASAVHLQHLTLAPIPAGSVSAKFDLTLSLHESDRHIQGTLEYAVDLFAQATIERLITRLIAVLETVTRAPDTRVQALPLLIDAEQHQLLGSWIPPQRAETHDLCLHQLFEAQAHLTPTATAIVFQDQTLSYQQLDQRSNQLARHLQQLGVGPEVLVGLCVERSLDMVVGILGILKAGGAYVPLDPRYPKERLAFMLADAGVSLLLTQERLRATLPDSQAPVLALDTPWEPVARDSARPPARPPHPQNLAHVIYTSGSTGKPKGVAITHHSAVCLIQWARDTFTPEALRGVLFSTSMCFDLSIFELHAPLVTGGTVILAEHALQLPEHAAHAAHAAITLINTVPSAMTELLRMRAVPPSVTTVCLAGEPLSRELARQVYAEPQIQQLYNLYGPTEDTTYSTAARVERTGVPHIGRPLPGGRAYVLDVRQRLAPIGVPGELYLGGVGVARGYLGRPALTAERFLPDPFSPEPGARMYRTGDVCRWSPDGTLEFLGRRDHQVKIRGFRVELGEIESQLRQHPAVREAAVLAREDHPGDPRLVAYLVAHQAPVPIDVLRRALQSQLPDYMVPSAFVELPALPLTPNGKLDHRALPAPGATHVAAAEAGLPARPPRTPEEAELRAIFATVLHLPPGELSVDQSFFALGGHSLLATQVISRITAHFGIDVPLRALFEAPTIATLARRIESQRHSDTAPAAAIPLISRAGALPLSFAQQRLWFIDRLEPRSTAYHIPLALHLVGTLSHPALRDAFQAVIARHETLRTTFGERDGVPVQQIQQIHAAPAFVLPIEDLTGHPAQTRTAQATRRAAEEASQPFDLATGPLLRALLLRLGPEEHVLVVTLHHITADGWSMDILARELAAGYAAFAAGTTPALPPLPIQYADYAAWQQQALSGPVLAQQRSYWQTQLRGLVPLELPTDHVRPNVASQRGGAVPVALSAQLSQALHALAQDHGATLFMVLLAAFQALLGRLAGTRDIAVGSPIAGRTRHEVEGLIGFFVNTLVLRANLAGNPTFTELLAQVRETALGAYAHQDIPFEKLVEELAPPRDLSRTPLFQVMFVLQNNPASAIHLGSLSLTPITSDTGSTKFDLTLSLQHSERDGCIQGTLHYAADLFERATVERLVERFTAVLHTVASDPSRRLAALPLVLPSEQANLAAWNATATPSPYPEDATILTLFAAQVERTPDAVAVVYHDQQLTYRELDRYADHIAAQLLAHGIGPESRVGLGLDRSLDLIAALLGILKAGAAYVPVDRNHPPERVRALLRNAQVELLIIASGRHNPPPVTDIPCLEIDRQHAASASQPPARVAPGVVPDNPAYLIHTSGSTGQPKAVVITHRSVVNLVTALQQRIYAPLGSTLRVAMNAPLTFDASVKQWTRLLLGDTLVLLDEADRLDADRLLATLRRQAVDVFDCTPTHLAILLEQGLGRDLAPACVLLGGEAIDPVLWQRLAQDTRTHYVNVYGPTECTVDTTVWSTRASTTPALGPPLPNVRAYVLDPTLQPTPIGVPGELYIAGAGLARGYDTRAATAERFLPDPFSATPGARMYRSGDQARWTPSGQLVYLGRIDHQVKVRGFRIELGEIEVPLRRFPGISEAVVALRHDHPGQPQLVAYYLPGEPHAGPLDPDALRQHLGRTLPEYMLPSAFVALDAWPLLPSGKLDRRALPPPGAIHRGAPIASTPPRTPGETLLRDIYAAVLHLPPDELGIDHSFFALGGHSLLATQVISRIRAALQIEVPVRALFEAPTPRELAARIEQTRPSAPPALPPIVPIPRQDPLPLSFAQQRLWFIDRLQPGQATYNMPHGLRLRGPLAPQALQGAFQTLIERHETLRTTFTEHDGHPVQQIHPPPAFALPLVDLSPLPPDTQQAEVARRAAEDALRPFDLAAGPLLRAALLRLSGTEHVLLLCMHHIASDGWSMDILARELATGYAALAAGHPPEHAPLPIQYADYAAWQRSWLQGPVLDTQLAYWKQQLHGAPTALDLPSDRPRPAVQTYVGASIPLALPQSLAAALAALSQRHGTTLFMTLLAAFQALLQRHTGQDDIVVGSPIAGRTHTQVEGLIGFFVNTLVLRTDLSGTPTVAELLRRVREVTLTAYDHQDLPFEKLVEELAPVRDRSRSPLFQVMFVLQNTARPALDLGPVQVSPIDLAPAAAKYDLTLSLQETADGIRGTLQYNTDLYDPSTLERFARHYQRLLQAFAIQDQGTVATLPLLDPSERALLQQWSTPASAAPTPAPDDRAIDTLFAQQATQTPDAIAVVFAGQTLTYRQLDQWANQLAHHLRTRGVGAETLVGVCLERSLERVIALLGILKAGGAYLPLDPTHPEERLAFMLQDTRAPLVLTEERFRPLLAGLPVPLLCMEHEQIAIAAHPTTPPPHQRHADQLAYVVYTSGSTGTPKGVLVTHRGVVRLVKQQTYAQLDASQVFLQLAPLGFDAATFELWAPLLGGGRLVVFPPEPATAATLQQVLQTHHVTTLWLTASLLNTLIDTDSQCLASLTQLLAGGEALSVPHIEKARRELPNVRLINGYGPTESTTFTCTHPISTTATASIPIGRPIANTRVYILDPSLQPTPIGIPGELYIGGAGLARGYLSQPQLTAERFIPDPLTSEPGARLYKTGDLCRWLPSGEIEFLGRIDQQVKIRGFRIELGEIEATLASFPGVRAAAVLARQDRPGDKQLCAYLVPQDPSAPPAREPLRAHLAQKLPEYMIPSAFVFLPSLPLTPNGKLDRRALPPPTLASEAAQHVSPRTLLEHQIAACFQTCLSIERVSIHDDFFALGGHSLLAVRLLHEIEQRTGQRLSLAQLFGGATVQAIAAALQHQTDRPRPASLVPLRTSGSRPPLYLVHPVGGSVFPYLPLTTALGPDHPVYAFQSSALEVMAGDTVPGPGDDLEVLAARYVRDLQRVIPTDRPYWLGGWSFGGVVAYAMAAQLQAAGLPPRGLLLLDSRLPVALGLAPSDPPIPDLALLALVAHELGLTLPQELAEPGPRTRDDALAWLVTQTEASGRLPAGLARRHLERVLRVCAAHLHGLKRYRPQPSPLHITLVRPEQPLAGAAPTIQDPSGGFSALTPHPIAIHTTPGDHFSMLRPPHNASLAALIGRIVE